MTPPEQTHGELKGSLSTLVFVYYMTRTRRPIGSEWLTLKDSAIFLYLPAQLIGCRMVSLLYVDIAQYLHRCSGGLHGLH